jgi:hypothetical protein
MKKSVYLMTVLAIMAAYLQYEVLAYRALVPVLLWSNATLYLNVKANREGWRVCKWFNICDLRSIPQSQIIWRGEMAFRG